MRTAAQSCLVTGCAVISFIEFYLTQSHISHIRYIRLTHTFAFMRKPIGTSKVAIGRKISLIKPVADKLGADEGDLIVFYEDGDRVYIEKVVL